MFDFSNQIVMVTGGSGNLGSAVARAYGAAGATLVLPDRKAGRLAESFPELAQSGRHFFADKTDISQPEDAKRLVAQTLKRYGKIDVLAHTVGGYRAGKIPHETELKTWDFMHDLNARTTFIINRAVVPAMLENGRGAIVNTASGSALSAGSRDIAYAASKADVIRITESMSKAYKGAGISGNAVLPGTIDTPENRAAMPNADFGKWVKPEAIAEVILFLTSPAGRVINGAAIPVLG